MDQRSSSLWRLLEPMRQGCALSAAAVFLLAGCGRTSSDAVPATPNRATAVEPAAPASGQGAGEAKRRAMLAAKDVILPVRPSTLSGNYDGLIRARWAMERQGNTSKEFESAMQAVGQGLREVKVTLGTDPLVWNRLNLNAPGAGLDGFRFRSPLKENVDLYLTFTASRPFDRFYILASDGSLTQRFTTYAVECDLDLPGLPVPRGQLFYLIPLLGGHIRPGTQYIVWFSDESTAPLAVDLALRLVPAGARGDKTDLVSVARTLQIDIKYRQDPVAADRIPALFSAARSLLNQDQPPAALQRVLHSLRDHLPEVSPSREPAVVWNRISTDESVLFNAVRFRTPVEGPCDLNLALLTQENMACNVVPAEGDLSYEQLPYKLEVDVPFEEATYPRRNLVTLMALKDGILQPGRDYFLCFRRISGVQSEMHLALRLAPADDSSPRAIAEAVGLKLPAGLPSPDRVASVFSRCRALRDPNRLINYAFNRLLEFALPALPEVPYSQGDVVWTHMDSRIESQRLPPQFRAYRFTSPLSGRADLDFLVVSPAAEHLSWGCLSFNPDASYLGTPIVEHDLNWEGTDFPDETGASFNVARGGIQPGVPYVVYFATRGDMRIPYQFALRLSKRGQFPVSSNPEALAARFGLKAVSKDVPTGSRAFDAHSEPVTGVVVTPDGEHLVTASMDGTLKLWELGTKKLLRTHAAGPGVVSTICRNPPGSHLAAATNGEIVVWDLQKYQVSARINTQDRLFRNLCLSSDGRWLAGCGPVPTEKQQQSGVLLWDIQAPEQPRRVPTNGASIECLAMTGDGRTLILGGHRLEGEAERQGGVLQFVDCESLMLNAEIADLGDPWKAMSLSADGQRLACARTRCLLQVWDMATRKVIAAVGQDSEPGSIAISTDGSRVATASSDGTVRLWDAATMRMTRFWEGHLLSATTCSFTPSGNEVVSGGSDGTIRLWDTAYRDEELSQPGFFEPIVNSIGMKLTPVPAGEFMMGERPNYDWSGGEAGDGGKLHRVRISRPLYLGTHEVTVAQYRRFVEETGYVTQAEKSATGGSAQPRLGDNTQWRNGKELDWKNPGYPQEDAFPVSQMSWDDAVAFCTWLSRKEHVRYRLPTEAEWEYACRAGSETICSFGNDSSDVQWCANTFQQAPEATNDRFQFAAPVGSFLPNALGLYDMHGNVSEWCSDWYGSDYYRRSEDSIDPAGPSAGSYRVQRGGSFAMDRADCRSSARFVAPPEETQFQTGFRVVREMP